MSLISLLPLIPSVSTWTPATQTGLLYWFDASNTGSITKDGSNRVSQWNDLSGNARHATQATDAKKPIYTASSLNGLAGLTFTSSSTQYMGFGTDVLFTSGSAITLVNVFKNTAGSATWYQVVNNLKGADALRNFVTLVSNDASYTDITFGYTGGGSGVAQCRVTSDFSSAANMWLDYNGGTVTSTGSYGFYKANSSVTVNTSGVSNTNAQANYLGRFANVTEDFTFNGVLYESYAWNVNPSSGTRTLNQTYLHNKWGT